MLARAKLLGGLLLLAGCSSVTGPDCPCTRWETFENDGESEDGSVRFALAREFCVELGGPCAFAGGCPVRVTRFELTFGGSTYVADRSDQLAYQPSHHHGADALTATLSDRQIHWRTEMDFAGDGRFHHHVWADDLEGAELLPETEVPPTTCAGGPPLCAYGCTGGN